MTTISVTRILCDFLVLCCCAIPLLIFHEFVKPYKRGFYCDDETIRYPFRASTVSRQMLIVIGLIIPTALILLTEVFRTQAWEKKCKDQFKQYQMRHHHVHRLIVRLYVFIGYFFVGVCFNQLMVDIAKYTIGRQRPHFMDVCRPNKGYDTCLNPDEYITDFECTGQDKKLNHEAQLSFYSGHAAFSFYAAWYTSLYLQARLYRPLYSRLIIPCVQFSLFGGASFVAYSRISDYKHHWSDVLVGIFMGSALGIYVALFVAEVFKRREIPVCDAYRAQGIQRDNELGLMAMKTSSPPEGATVTTTHTITVHNENDQAQRLLHGRPANPSGMEPLNVRPPADNYQNGHGYRGSPAHHSPAQLGASRGQSPRIAVPEEDFRSSEGFAYLDGGYRQPDNGYYGADKYRQSPRRDVRASPQDPFDRHM